MYLSGEELLSKASILSSIPAKDKFAPGYYHRLDMADSVMVYLINFIMHNSFGVTENYIVFMEQPLKIDLRKFYVLTLLGKPLDKMLTWKPSENVRQYLASYTVELQIGLRM